MRLDAEALEMVAANEADWDARAALHAASRFYSQPAEYWFGDYEWEDLGPLDGRDVLHLQCHLGTETIAFARRGARTVGLDLSSRSLEEARKLAGNQKVDIEYVARERVRRGGSPARAGSSTSSTPARARSATSPTSPSGPTSSANS